MRNVNLYEKLLMYPDTLHIIQWYFVDISILFYGHFRDFYCAQPSHARSSLLFWIATKLYDYLYTNWLCTLTFNIYITFYTKSPLVTKKRKIDKSSIKTTELPSNSSTVKLAENTANTLGDVSSNKIPCNAQDSIDTQKTNTTKMTATTSTNSSANSTDSTGGIKEGKGQGSDELNSKVLESGSSSLSMLGGYDSDDE